MAGSNSKRALGIGLVVVGALADVVGIAGTIGVLTKPTDESSLTSAVAFALRRSAEAPPSLRCFS